MMSQEEIPLDQIKELYSIRGHRIAEVVERSSIVTDLVISSREGEKWIARYARVAVVDVPVIQELLVAKQKENANQAALITSGTITAGARLMSDGKSIHLADRVEFDKYLLQARTRASAHNKAPKRNSAISVFLHRLNEITYKLFADKCLRRVQSPRPSDSSREKNDLQSQLEQKPASAPQGIFVSESSQDSITQNPSVQIPHSSAPTSVNQLQVDNMQVRDRMPQVLPQPIKTYVRDTPSPSTGVSVPIVHDSQPKKTCPHGASRREECAICLGLPEYQSRYGDWQSD